jgi:glycosyltransferase involved in cell wall biosynthesis
MNQLNNPDKVLYVVGHSFAFQRSKTGGFISSAKGVIDGLCEHGFEVHIVTDSLLPGINNDRKKKYHYYSFRLLRRFIPVKTRINIKNSLTYLDSLLFKYSIKKTLIRLIENNTFKLIYLRASHSGQRVAEIALKYNIPLVLEVNKPLSMGPYNQRKGGLIWPKKKSDVKVYNNERIQYEVARVITVDSPLRGKWITDFVDQKYGNKMVINPNAVNSAIFKPSNNDQSIRKKYSIDDSKILVGMASSFRWYNDEIELCEIIKATIKENDNIVFLFIIGDMRRVKPIKSLIEKNNLKNNTVILEQVPFSNMPNVLNMCDILISHFNFHGVWPHNCSIKHLEYLAVGKPVVATNVGFVNFAIEHDINGIMVKEGDVNGFSKAVLKLVNEKDTRKIYGKNGREKALNKLTWYNNVDKFLNLLNKQKMNKGTNKYG